MRCVEGVDDISSAFNTFLVIALLASLAGLVTLGALHPADPHFTGLRATFPEKPQ